MNVDSSTSALDTGRRTFAELKAETQRRAERNLAPLTGIDPEDAREALAAITACDRNVWAAGWSAVGSRFAEEASVAERADAPRARALYLRAWHNFNIARWPTENATGKHHAYAQALEAFAAYARLLQPAIEIVRIPFQGREIVGYLRLPVTVRPAPVVISIAGLDSRKEDIGAGSDSYLARGLGVMALDMPGTGQAPLKVDIGAERMFSAVLDYLATRSEIDAGRVVVQGRSWSGYFAAVLAYTEKARVRGTVVQGGPIHHYFQREWQERGLDTPEYLYDLYAARAAIYPGIETRDQFFAFLPRLSLVARGLIDAPSAPILLINGARDTQVPIDDVLLLLQHGAPKEAWINPAGGHMGRSPEFPSPAIARQVVIPWILRAVGGKLLMPKG